MYIPLGVKTDYTLLSSLIKIPDLISFALQNKLNCIGILDDNLSSSLEFYDLCIKNNIKPVIGLKVFIDNNIIYLYAKNYNGYKNLLKINTKISNNTLSKEDIKTYNKDLKIVIPFNYYDSFIKDISSNIFISYKNDYQKRNALLITNNIVYINEMVSFAKNDINYLEILYKINNKELIDKTYYYYQNDLTEDDIDLINKFVEDINIEIEKNKRYIPIYNKDVDSKTFLFQLCNKGLYKRLNGLITKTYQDRLNYELKVIENMGFIDYFLIVYDYVLYAKKNNCLVGPGRGSAAGSLVSYCLGITEIDPVKYNLLFERFLNPSRITMPDIDIDFEDSKRNDIVNYVRNKYGYDKVAPILTYGTLASRQVLKDVAKVLSVESSEIDKLTKLIDSKLSLKENLNNNKILSLLKYNSDLSNVYKISMHLENLKRHTSIHAAGVVISSTQLDDIIPVIDNKDTLITGVTMNYLEELGLLKMDFLSLSNLSIIHNILDLIPNKIKLNNIRLDDSKVFDLFLNGDISGIFQFESNGMKNLIKKLKPNKFSDLVASVALFRPGPMNNIDTFIRRKHNEEKITYIDSSLEPILKDTYGIIVYQEQIMQILVLMAKFTFSEADNIRRAMSKKKIDIIKNEKERFIGLSMKNGYSKEQATNVYDLIEKFANYGFNKAHSVSYALIGYQMAYLKTYYKKEFICGILNLNINSEEKTKEYLSEAKKLNIVVLSPDINLSDKLYKFKNNSLLLPLSVIKNVGIESVNTIIKVRNEKKFEDFFDFVERTYNLGINKKILISLINANVFNSFLLNHQTLINMIDSAIRYAEIAHDLDVSLIEKPVVNKMEEYSDTKLMQDELDSFGFYISNHPASKYNAKDIVKINNIKEYFNKYVKCVVLINKISKIKTKTGDEMAFVKGSDETGEIEFVLFPKYFYLINTLKKDSLVLIYGVVARRVDKYQINISSISGV